MASRPPWERYAEPAQAQPIITRQADPRLPIQTQRERVGLPADVESVADEIAAVKRRLGGTPRNGLGAFLHEALTRAKVNGMVWWP